MVKICHGIFILPGGIIIARKSRKQPIKTIIDDVRSAVGYIRLSVANKDEPYSVENQKHITNQWAAEHAPSISHFYIDENHSGSNSDRLSFKQILEGIDIGRIEMFILTTHLYCDILILK